MVGHSTKEALTDGCGHNRMDIEPTERKSNHNDRVDAARRAGVRSRRFPTAPDSRRQGRAMWPAPRVLGLAGHELFLASFQLPADWLQLTTQGGHGIRHQFVLLHPDVLLDAFTQFSELGLELRIPWIHGT
jgi:hypothetical protein